jgi:hypothetical protein
MAAKQRKTTNRGFAIYDEFTDSYGNHVRVQQSSNIEGGTWIYTKKADDPDMDWTPHLNKRDLKRLIKALNQSLKDQYGESMLP